MKLSAYRRGFGALLLILLWSVVGLLPAGKLLAQDGEPAYGNPDLLVNAEWVADHVDDTDLVIVDVRERVEYENGHVPGAVNLDLRDVNKPENDVPDQVTDPETTAEVLGGLAITPEKTVVIYDDGTILYATRLFWILEYYGYSDIRVLDGGFPAWVDADQPLDETPVEPEAVELELSAHPALRVEGEWIVHHLADPTLRLLDARFSAEYNGISAVSAGHIPGAHNVDWHLNLDSDGLFLTPAALEAVYAKLDLGADQQIVVYCSTGYRASVLYFSLRLLGYDNVALYDGSWAEWSQHDDWVVETGIP